MTALDTQTPTPRTDKALRATQGLFRAASATNGFTGFARTLERELAEAQRQLAEHNDLLQKVYAAFTGKGMQTGLSRGDEYRIKELLAIDEAKRRQRAAGEG